MGLKDAAAIPTRVGTPGGVTKDIDTQKFRIPAYWVVGGIAQERSAIQRAFLMAEFI
jgi:hypothetical protein